MVNPYELWDTRKSLGVMRDVEPAFNYWMSLGFPNQVNSVDEYIDFEKLPVVGRKLAPFVRPLGTGKPIYTDRSTAARFKPAYVKIKEAIDPTRPLTKLPGIDTMLDMQAANDPMARRRALKAAMTQHSVTAIQRRWEWMAARAIIDSEITIEGEEYPAVVLDFDRAANQTIVLVGGDLWTDTTDIFADIQTWADRMFNAPFGGFPTRITMGSRVWAVWRSNDSIMAHMDTQIRGAASSFERGIIAGEKVVKVGELTVGGASGATIELFLYRDTYEEGGVEVPFMEDTDIVMTAAGSRINGYRAFGAIIDPFANYLPMDIFSRNWMEQGDPAVEYLLFQSAPLMVPVNPNATLKATVVAGA